MMRTLTLLFSLCFIQLSFSQGIPDLGKMNFEQVKSKQTVSPCEITPNKALRYCVSDGSFIVYTFENNKLSGIIFLTSFPTRSSAESELTIKVNEFSKNSNKNPVYTSGMVLFNMTDQIGVTFEIKEIQGTYYLTYSTLLL